ncbi:hypothetical protein CY35_11G119600, partial [Sphagnum magellanicum]
CNMLMEKDGQLEKAMQLFQKMQREGTIFDKFTFVQAIKACVGLGGLEDGRLVHQQLMQSGCEFDIFLGNSLVDMYAKCEWLDFVTFVGVLNACAIMISLEKGMHFDVYVGNSLVDMYAKRGSIEDAWKALELFQQMRQEGVWLSSITFVGVLNAFANLIALEEGISLVDMYAKCKSIEDGVQLSSVIFVRVLNACASVISLEEGSLVDMYAKCGSIEDAWRVFNKMPSQNVVTWTAILGGCAMHGHGRERFKHFEQMCEEGAQPNDIYFVCLLSACSHAGLHYICMANLLGHAGHLQEAENMVKAMPFKPDVAAWMTFLSTCKIHGNVEMTECVAKRVLELEPENVVGYVLLANIYVSAGNMHLCEDVEQQRKENIRRRQSTDM